MGSRRNPRRAAATTDTNLAKDDDGSENEASISSENPASSSDDDDDVIVVDRKTVNRKTTTRTSSRSTKFTSSMKEPSGDSIRDLLHGQSEYQKEETPSPRRIKSPAKSHSSARRRIHIEVPVDSESSSEEEESEDEEEQDELKIQRIVASKSEPRRVWKEICNSMNTTEVTYGSRWYQEGEDNSKEDTFEERFLVKWSDMSYLHCSWETQQDLIEQVEGAKTYLTTFFRKCTNGLLFSADERCDGDYFDPGFVQVDRILEVAIPDNLPKGQRKGAENPIDEFGIVMDRANPDFEMGTGRQFLIKWCNTPYSDSTYEFERDLILNEVDYLEHLKAFEQRSKKPSKIDVKESRKIGEAEKRRSYKLFGDKSNVEEEEKEAQVRAYQDELANQVFPNGGQLRDYQAEGVTWLISNLINRRSSILTDEMGLGKTLQTAAFVNLVAKRLQRRGPFLIVAPLSTIQHWYREFTTWTDLNTIIYHGSQDDRDLIRQYEMAFECDRPKNGVGFNQSYLRKCMPNVRSSLEREWMAQVVITTPEMLVTDDHTELTAVPWEIIVVDEAHRLKNHNSKLVTNLRNERFDFRHALLLTGTPIQNNMTELWTLLNFVDPEEYDDMNSFLERYGDIKSKERIDELHESIRPYILRRLKEDVEKSVPPKEETLIEVELTVLQKQYYRALYEKNVQFLHKNKKKALDGPSLSNLAMQLRKCCNHPFLLRGVEEEIRKQEANASEKASEGDFLAKASGKLVLLDKLLPRLKENGHRVLIFSQFKIMLDILEDYLSARELKFERIDGSITGSKRQMSIDRFQSPPGEGRDVPFVMLLSTRAGGVGINLTAADTCIIFDSDWNPQNDLQAQARCHRIGQTKSVKVYRLLTRKTYEMQMFHMSSLKMGLDQAVLQGFESGGSSGEGAMTKEEVERLLRHGAYDIFNEEKAGSADAESNDFVQQDIDSILARRSKTVVHDQTGSNSNAAGGTFSKASFRAPKTPGGQEKAKDDDIDIDDPDFWTKMVGEPKFNDNETVSSGMKRKRMSKNYSEIEYENTLDGSLRLSDSDASFTSDSPSDDWSLEDVEPETPDSNASQVAKGSPEKRRKKKKKEKARWGGSGPNEWDKKNAENVLKVLQMYGYGNLPWTTFMEKAAVNTNRLGFDEVKRMCWSMLLLTLREAADEDALNAKRRAERAAARKRESDGAQAPGQQENGGVLGADSDVLTREKEADDSQLDASLKKLVDANVSWLHQVVQDANTFAEANLPRTKSALTRAMKPHLPAEPSTAQKGVIALFVDNIWPSLKTRGWTAAVITEGESFATCYVHSGKQYHSPHAVLLAVPGIHPELSKTVETILSSTAMQLEPHEEEAHVNEGMNLQLETVSCASLSSFLDMYAPLQLLVDRAKNIKITMARKALGTCTALAAAHALVSRASDSPGPSTVTDRLANLLPLNKRIALPHPSWTPRHDAVLIQAIAKHGWIDQDHCCHAISEDSSIKWGAPFDEGGDSKPAAADESTKEQQLVLLRETAVRASAFFNAEQDILDELKGFNQALVVKAYGLVNCTEGVDSSSSRWEADDNLLLKAFSCPTATATSVDSDGENNGVDMELPTKKDLLKRAKNILSRSSAPSERETDVATKAVVLPPDHGFTALDQSDPCNMLLAEMLRGLLKVSFTKTSKAKNLSLKVCADALREARRLQEGATNHGGEGMANPQAEDLQKIVEHIKMVGENMSSSPRLAKNVLRVVLGDTPILPKNPSEPTFPVVGATKLDISWVDGGNGLSSRGATKLSTKKQEHQEGTTGSRAITSAISLAFEEYKESSGSFSTTGDSSRLELSAVETLLISVICSQGLPAWSENWMGLFTENHSDPELQGPGHENAITWFGVGLVTEKAAEVWHKTALDRLQRAQESMKTASNNDRLLEEIKQLEVDERFKRRAVADAKNDRADPAKLAKKCVMLLEALRTRMGPVDTKRGNTLKKIKSLSKSENGLGQLVLGWFAKELFRWAQSLDILDATQRPHGYTAFDFAGESDVNGIGVLSIMDKKSCRAVIAQIAQLSRARAVFVRNGDEEMRTLVDRAAKNSSSLEDVWEKRPSWWNVIHDHDLLAGILECGYSGCDGLILGMQQTAAVQVDDEQVMPTESRLTVRSVQRRANQLTRELHALEETADMMRLVDERRTRPSNGSSPKALSEIQQNKERPGSAHGVQTGIQAFFSTSKPASNDQKRENEVIALIDSDSDSEVKVVSPPRRDSDGDSEIEVVSPWKRYASGKRKECEPDAGSEAASAEKKSKTA